MLNKMSNIISKITEDKTDTIMIEKMEAKLEMKHKIEYVDNIIYTRKQKRNKKRNRIYINLVCNF